MSSRGCKVLRPYDREGVCSNKGFSKHLRREYRLFCSNSQNAFAGGSTSHHSRPSLFSQWCSTYLGIKGLGEERYADELAFLDTRTGDKVAAIVRPRIADVQIFPDGKKLALMTFENNQSIIEIWDIPPRKPLRWILGLLAIPGVVTLFAIRRWRKASKRSSI